MHWGQILGVKVHLCEISGTREGYTPTATGCNYSCEGTYLEWQGLFDIIACKNRDSEAWLSASLSAAHNWKYACM